MKKIFALLFFVSGYFLASAGIWTQKTNFGGAPRAYHPISFTIGAYAYVGLGYNSSTYYQDIWQYDQTANTWTQKANFPGAGSLYASCFAANGKGYVGTGRFVSNVYNYLYEYDPAGNTWTQKANFGGTARCAAIGFSIGNFGYIGSGGVSFTSLTFYSDCWRYNTLSNSWTQKANFTGFGRDGGIGLSIADKGYFGLGWHNPYDKDWWEYDTTTNTWTQKANFTGSARTGPTGFAIGTKCYVGGGYDGSSERSDFWEWDQFLNIWTSIPNFPGGNRSQMAGTNIGNKGYVGLGYNGSVYFNDWWEYDPNMFTAVGEQTNANELSVFPNPTKGKFTVNTAAGSLEIFNVDGEIIYSTVIEKQNTEVDLTNSPAGIYFVKVTHDAGTIFKKVMKE